MITDHPLREKRSQIEIGQPLKGLLGYSVDDAIKEFVDVDFVEHHVPTGFVKGNR